MLQHPDFSNGNIYLSGGMQHTPDKLGAGWRATCSIRLKAMGFFPLDIAELDTAYSKVHGNPYRDVDPALHLVRKSNVRKHFIETDVALIRNDADAVIILYDDSVRRGAGTISEVHEAHMLDIPVFLMNTYGDLDQVPEWMHAETTKIFDQWEDLYDYLGSLPQGILKRDVYGNRRSGSKYLCSLCGTAEEKHGAHFVSKITPQLCKSCVDIYRATAEMSKDRYQFFLEHLDGTKQHITARQSR